MSTFKVDNEQVKESVETLKKLLEECEELYNKEIPESTVDKGKTHNELLELCENVKITCQYLGELINNTILFLGESSEMFETSDKDSAAAIAISIASEVTSTVVSNSSNSSNDGYKYNGVSYSLVVNNFDNCKMSQNSYDGDMFGYGDYNCGCTSTAWCSGLSMITGKTYNPTSSEMWIPNEGATFNGQGDSVWANESGMLKEAYAQLQKGKPSVFYANHPYNYMHAVTIVGVSPTAVANDLKMSDFLVMDPWGGTIKTLDQVGYSGEYGPYSRLITYGNNLP